MRKKQSERQSTAASILREVAALAEPSPSTTCFAPSLMNFSSLLTAMNCQPSAIRDFASSTLNVWMPAGDADPLAARQDVRQRLLEHLGRRRLAVGVAHARGQVVRADEDRVDAGHREHLVEVPHRLDVLALEDDEHLVVGLRVVVGGRGGEVQRVDAAADAAVAARRVQARGHRACCASSRVMTIGTTTP